MTDDLKLSPRLTLDREKKESQEWSLTNLERTMTDESRPLQ